MLTHTVKLTLIPHMNISGRTYYKSSSKKTYCLEGDTWYQTCKEGEPQEDLEVIELTPLNHRTLYLTFRYKD